MADKTSKTFAVHEVTPATRAFYAPEQEAALRSLFEPFCKVPEHPFKILAVDQTPKRLVNPDNGRYEPQALALSNGLAGACVFAWNNHYSLELSPDMIWIAIVQGLAAHVTANAEKLRPLFVKHEGKETIEIDNQDGKYGDIQRHFAGKAAFQWPEVIEAFSVEIGERTKGGVREIVECDYSTSGLVETTVSQIALMDAMQPYFDYVLNCICGIPKITLTGTVADWKKIRAKAEALAAYDLDWWLTELLPVLDQFVKAREGQPDVSFWRRICRQDGGTGPIYNRVPEFVSGWLSVFFPYDNNNKQRELRWDAPKPRPSARHGQSSTEVPHDPEAAKDQSAEYGLRIQNDDFPTGVSSAPVLVLLPFGSRMSIRLFGGLVGVEQDPETLTLKPSIAWCVGGRMGEIARVEEAENLRRNGKKRPAADEASTSTRVTRSNANPSTK